MWTTEQLVTICIALYGAFLSTLLGIYELNKNKPSIKLSFSTGSLIEKDMRSSELMIILSALNKGQTKIVLTGCGWTSSDKHKYHIAFPCLITFPYVLEPHRKADVYFACRWFKDLPDKEKINGIYFEDEEGNTWRKRIRKKDKVSWEKTHSQGYLIEFDYDQKIFYRKDIN